MCSHADIRIRRSEGTIVVASLVLLAMHIALCRPAAVSRGSLVNPVFWEGIALFVCYAAVPVFSLLNDRLTWRWCGIAIFLIPGLIMTATALRNVQIARPRPGSYDGIAGLIRNDFLGVITFAILLAVLIVPVAHIVDTVANRFWQKHRQFIEPDSGEDLRFSIRAMLTFTFFVCVLATCVNLLRR